MFDDEPTHDFSEYVTHWQTKDGKLHDTTTDVERHIVNVLTDKLGPIIDDANRTLNPQHALGPKAKLAIVEALVGSPDKARNLKKLLGTLV